MENTNAALADAIAHGLTADIPATQERRDRQVLAEAADHIPALRTLADARAHAAFEARVAEYVAAGADAINAGLYAPVSVAQEQRDRQTLADAAARIPALRILAAATGQGRHISAVA